MTKKEKFEARLRELGIYDEWDRNGLAGAETDKEIVVLVHYDYEENDPYTEYHYPRFDAMSRDQIDTLVSHFASDYSNADIKEESKFFSELASWCAGNGKCPLFPCDVYTNLQETEWFQFEDDVETDEDDREETEYQELLNRHIGVVDVVREQLGHFRKRLLDAIAFELRRGHNLQDDFEPYPGWDSYSLYGYMISEKNMRITEEDNDLYIALSQEGYEDFFIPLAASDFPIDVLINIFGAMK